MPFWAAFAGDFVGWSRSSFSFGKGNSMISAGGLLGKIVEFLASELSKRKLARDSDNSAGQACQAFTRLYFLLVDVQAITDYVRERIVFGCGKTRN